MPVEPHNDILIGATGWNHSDWIGSYYPQDLPEDWRLSYYSNELNTVLVTERDWSHKQKTDLKQWVNDTHDEFIFFFELDLFTCTNMGENRPLATLLNSLNNDLEQVGGLLITVPANASEADLLKVAPFIPKGLAVNFNFAKSTLSQAQRQNLVGKLNIGPVWYPDITDDNANNNKINKKVNKTGNLCLGLLNLKTVHSNEQLKNYFEQFRSISHKSSVRALFLCGQPPDINNLRNIKMIKELIIG